MMCQSHSAINFATSSFGFCVVGFQYISPWAVFMRFTWMQMNERGSFPPTVTSFHIKPVLHHISQCCCCIKSWALKRHLMIVFSVFFFFLLVQTSCTHEKLTIFFTFRTRLTVHSWTRTLVRYALWVPEHFRTFNLKHHYWKVCFCLLCYVYSQCIMMSAPALQHCLVTCDTTALREMLFQFYFIWTHLKPESWKYE